MPQLSEYETRSLDKLCQTVQEDKWSNEGLVQLIERCGSFLNLESVPDFSASNKISDRAARNNTSTRKNRKVFNVNFVYDNY
jgi:hypothetical protein